MIHKVDKVLFPMGDIELLQQVMLHGRNVAGPFDYELQQVFFACSVEEKQSKKEQSISPWATPPGQSRPWCRKTTTGSERKAGTKDTGRALDEAGTASRRTPTPTDAPEP